MALINRQTCSLGHSSSCRYENDLVVFGASRETLAQLDDSTKGFVHVLPVEIVEIGFADFRPPIKEISHGPQ
jgi:hypothetical protein